MIINRTRTHDGVDLLRMDSKTDFKKILQVLKSSSFEDARREIDKSIKIYHNAPELIKDILNFLYENGLPSERGKFENISETISKLATTNNLQIGREELNDLSIAAAVQFAMRSPSVLISFLLPDLPKMKDIENNEIVLWIKNNVDQNTKNLVLEWIDTFVNGSGRAISTAEIRHVDNIGLLYTKMLIMKSLGLENSIDMEKEYKKLFT